MLSSLHLQFNSIFFIFTFQNLLLKKYKIIYIYHPTHTPLHTTSYNCRTAYHRTAYHRTAYTPPYIHLRYTLPLIPSQSLYHRKAYTVAKLIPSQSLYRRKAYTPSIFNFTTHYLLYCLHLHYTLCTTQ